MNEQNKSPGQLAYEFLSSLSSNPLFKWSSLDLQWQQSWEQTAAFMAGKTTQAPLTPPDTPPGDEPSVAEINETLQEAKAEKWAKEREHFAKGGRIQFDVGDGTWRDWRPTEAPAFPNLWAWRIHPEDIKLDRCPTCGVMRGQPAGLTGFAIKECCKDKFHTSAAATPAPEPWRPKYKVGDKVTLENGSHSKVDRIVLGSMGYHVEGFPHWWTTSEKSLTPYAWTMPVPPAGHSWRMKYPWPTSRDQVNLAR